MKITVTEKGHQLIRDIDYDLKSPIEQTNQKTDTPNILHTELSLPDLSIDHHPTKLKLTINKTNTARLQTKPTIQIQYHLATHSPVNKLDFGGSSFVKAKYEKLKLIHQFRNEKANQIRENIKKKIEIQIQASSLNHKWENPEIELRKTNYLNRKVQRLQLIQNIKYGQHFSPLHETLAVPKHRKPKFENMQTSTSNYSLSRHRGSINLFTNKY